MCAVDLAAHVGLVRHIVRKMGMDRIDHDEAVAIGLLAMVEAAPRYDPSRGQFSSFIAPRIRGAVIDEYRKLYGRKDHSMRPVLWSLDKLLQDAAGHEDMHTMLILSLEDTSVHWQEWGESAVDTRKVMRRLRPRERVIVRQRAKGRTFKSIGDELGISESRVCQVLRKMRERIAA